ncbi:hypothetical protein EX30DRAFT_342496 [Ascodesmis nigricans]|uniref:Uncharacterized protein n=1 Tax=Ascodesmis nigricans TaxID=341454 RepID=A0A4S2MQB2_9PEZI|nr:hypothetical protein EX30DRAFT_342496 [Ascodesmis nigricans]
MASIPAEISAVLRDENFPLKIKSFLESLETLNPDDIPHRSESRLPVESCLSDINRELASLAVAARAHIGSARTSFVISSLTRNAKRWESNLKSAFKLKPPPFDGLLQKHVLIGSGSYQRSVDGSRKVFEDIIHEFAEGDMGFEMSEDGLKKVEDIAVRTLEVIGRIDRSIKEPEFRKVRNKTVNALVNTEVQKLAHEWTLAWKDDWAVWYRYWCV